jgi:hypothetical protein
VPSYACSGHIVVVVPTAAASRIACVLSCNACARQRLGALTLPLPCRGIELVKHLAHLVEVGPTNSLSSRSCHYTIATWLHYLVQMILQDLHAAVTVGMLGQVTMQLVKQATSHPRDSETSQQMSKQKAGFPMLQIRQTLHQT